MTDQAWKLKIELHGGEVHISGDRGGLKFLAEICTKLSNLADKDSATGANHWHLDAAMNTAEPGSVPTTVWLKTDL
jgi:hypothetical protein